ncbi:MAG: hypothetical protein KAR19_19220 [Bacteroidales bacterium]|nr:hypothetical protein [Bacteroidales bacterium]
MKKLIGLISILCLVSSSEAQLKTYLNLEAGPQWSMIKVVDPGNYFTDANVYSSIAGITIGQEVMPNLSVVTGVYYQLYRDGINMIDDRPQQSRWTAYTSLLIPLRAEYRIQLSEFPVSLTPRIGYIYGMFSQPEYPYDATGILSAPDGTAISYDLVQAFETEQLHMLETGISLGLRFSGFWQASLNLSYLTGFTEPMSTALDYTDQDGNNYSAVYQTKGNTIYTTLSFHVPVSNIWQNKDYRIRSRIENSVGKGKPTDRKGQVYIGAELGSLWRIFNTTNPAIGARPMEGRGIFQYANLHTGAYAGYMFSDELGIDIGVNYQRSSTFYALMYDHQVNFETKTPAPMFLEVPLRIRYFYNLYKEKLFYVVYGGASLLTHFSSEDYGSGGGPFTYTSPITGSPVNASSTYTVSRTSRFTPMLRFGTGVEYVLPMEFPLIATMYVNYMHGFISSDAIFISNTVPADPSGTTIIYNGSGWSVDLGIKVPFRFNEKGKCGKLPEKNQQP